MRVIVIDDLLAQLLSDSQLDLVLGWGFEAMQESPPLAGFVDPGAGAAARDGRSRPIT